MAVTILKVGQEAATITCNRSSGTHCQAKLA